MTAVPSIAEVPARPGRGTGPRHTADHCRLGPTNACLRRPALIVAECRKRLEFLDCETIANRRSWTWADETVRFLVARPNPGCDRAIERMWGKDRCTRRNPPIRALPEKNESSGIPLRARIGFKNRTGRRPV